MLQIFITLDGNCDFGSTRRSRSMLPKFHVSPQLLFFLSFSAHMFFVRKKHLLSSMNSEGLQRFIIYLCCLYMVLVEMS
jgi:hypothetical protein